MSQSQSVSFLRDRIIKQQSHGTCKHTISVNPEQGGPNRKQGILEAVWQEGCSALAPDINDPSL
jgi:hypothetical protein